VDAFLPFLQDAVFSLERPVFFAFLRACAVLARGSRVPMPGAGRRPCDSDSGEEKGQRMVYSTTDDEDMSAAPPPSPAAPRPRGAGFREAGSSRRELSNEKLPLCGLCPLRARSA